MAMRIYKYCLVAVATVFLFGGVKAQSVTFTPTNVTCNGAADATMKMDLTGGTSTYWYVCLNVAFPALSDSIGPTTDATHTFTNLSPGQLYLFYVRDNVSGDYVGVQTIVFTQPAVLNATVSSTNVTCFGGNNGSITFSGATGGSGAYEYTINGSSWVSTTTFSGLTAGNYNVQVRDKNAPGCLKVLNPTLNISQPIQLSATVASTDVTCFGKANGTIVISSPLGGSGTYQYSRNGGSSWQASGTFTALGPGTYNLVIRDAAVPTCFRSLGSVVITQPAQLRVDDITILKGLTCNEGSDGRLQAIVSGGTTPYTYNWFVNQSGSWVALGQNTAIANNLPQGWYEVRVNDANNCGNPIPVSGGEYFLEGFTDSIPPVFIFDSASVVNTCAGQTNGSITIYAHGGKIPYTYSITAGGASGYLSANLFSNLAAGTYETWARDKKGCAKSGPAKTIATTPNAPVSVSITANPAGSICPGTSVQFTATPVNGGTTPAYQWRLNGSNVGTGVATYTNSTLASGDQVSVILTSSLRCTSGNPATSNVIAASLLTPPAISAHPASATQCTGTNVTFSVTASGSGITYQWRKNGVNIPGATGSTYTLNNITTADAGNYIVVVTGTCGTVNSNAAVLTVNTAPAITAQPVSLVQCTGTNATFTVTATGTGLTYQWQKNGSNIAGATGAGYTITNIATTDAGSYRVVVTGTCGNITSNAATLTVNTPPAITAQPVGVTQCTGTGVTFSVTATGAGLTYQWRKNGTNIAGATGSTYTIASIATGDAGNYDVVITGTCGNVTSNAATLTVNTPPVITGQPVSIVQCTGTDATFNVTATGTGLTYQWRKDGVNIPGAINAAYTINNINASHAGSYTVVITGTCGNITSNAATLTVNTPPAITAQPVSVVLCEGLNATFSVTATGAGLTYQWRKDGVNISGATGSSYTITGINSGHAGSYTVVITGTCGSATSNAATLAVNTAPVITAQPVNAMQCPGTNVTFSVTATGTGLTYQWRKDGTNIAGATGSSYTINNINAGHAGSYTVVITGTCGNLTSNAAVLTVNAPPVITTQPVSVAQCTGANVTFSVTATGTGLTYQWRKDGVNIAGATAGTYAINNINATHAGNYDVVITGTCGNVTSNAAALTVNTPPAITTQPVSVAQCAGTNVTFSVTATGTGLAYQWRKDGANIAGATGSSYIINNINATHAGSYTVVITGTCGNLTSSAAVLTVNTAPAITAQPVNLVLCEGASGTFSVTATGTGLTYQWRKDGTNIAGATGSTYTIPVINATHAGNYDVVITGTCGSLTSNAASLTVNTPPSITAQPVSITQCAGTSATFSVTALGTGLTYQWRKNGAAISGATGTSYTIGSIAAGDAGNYDVVIAGTCGNLTSVAAVLTVNTPPSITAQPANATACEGTSASFSVTAVGTGLTYQWRRNGVIISGETNPVLTLNNITTANAGTYDVVITGTCGNVTSNTATLTVALNPVITGQPVGDQVCEGSDVSFSVAATGTALTYQWRKDGAALAGQTASVLSLTAVLPAQSGNYDVVVTGQCGTVTSSAAALIVDPATAVIESDSDTLVCEGGNVHFHVEANGQGAISYQWQWLYAGSWIDLPDGGDITGTATADFRIANVEIADTGFYRCFVSSACGSAYSDPVRIDVNHIVATIGTPAPFLINSSTTTIEVGVHVTDRLLFWDLGFALVAPDGTEVILKAPNPSLCGGNPYNKEVNATFTTEIDKSTGDTINWCVIPKLISGNFAATGDWNVLNGMDPANGAWQVRVYDSYNASAIFDGYLKLATLSFTDLNNNGDTVTVRYNSGAINEEILNPIAGELRSTSYVVPIRLMTSCANTQDAQAIVTVQGGVAPYTYQWTGPTSVPDVASVELGPGTYTVLVTDQLGCSSTATVEVSSPPAIMFDDVQHTDTLLCFDASDGIIRSKASGGTGTLTYTLLPGNIPSAVADSGVFLNLAAGAYTIRVTDISACSFDTVIRIFTRPELVVQVDVVPVIGINLGSITLTASGGTPPYQYSVDDGVTLQASGQFDDLPAGVYPVYVVDANGCIFTQDVNLTVNELNVTVNKNDVSCYGLADGSFYLATTDGTGPYTLTASWLSVPQTEPSGLFAYTGQTAGLYDIRIEDSQGWLFIDTVEILEPTEIVVTGVITHATCSAITKDGAIDITVTGGSGDFTYDWSNGASTQDLTLVEAGEYTVVVADENGCNSADIDFTILGLNVATAYAGEDATVCPASEYPLVGSIGDSVRWEPAELLDNPRITDPMATIDTRTTFIYTVYDNGCMDRDTLVLDVYERIGMDIYDPSGEVNIDTALFLLQGQEYTMAATPGFAAYQWKKDNVDISTEEFIVVSVEGYYDVIGTTDNGCIEIDRVHVVIARPIEIYSGFSPNDDGINDKWTITNAVQYGDKIRVKVFNRWGEPIFESKGYGASQEWDGTRNGKPMPVGAYYYIVEVNDGKSEPYTGTVTILR